LEYYDWGRKNRMSEEEEEEKRNTTFVRSSMNKE